MKKLFTNDIFFAVVIWFSALANIPYVISDYLYYLEPKIQFIDSIRLVMAACMVVLYIAYKKHSKNVMKGMMGAILTAALIFTLATVFLFEEYGCTAIIGLAITVAVFISHFVINSTHKASPAAICINQVLSIVYAVISLAAGLALIPNCLNSVDVVVTILVTIAQSGWVFGIICVESRLDAYRLDREAAGWTEEAGYPEGYVHEYQKKDNK